MTLEDRGSRDRRIIRRLRAGFRREFELGRLRLRDLPAGPRRASIASLAVLGVIGVVVVLHSIGVGVPGPSFEIPGRFLAGGATSSVALAAVLLAGVGIAVACVDLVLANRWRERRLSRLVLVAIGVLGLAMSSALVGAAGDLARVEAIVGETLPVPQPPASLMIALGGALGVVGAAIAIALASQRRRPINPWILATAAASPFAITAALLVGVGYEVFELGPSAADAGLPQILSASAYVAPSLTLVANIVGFWLVPLALWQVVTWARASRREIGTAVAVRLGGRPWLLVAAVTLEARLARARACRVAAGVPWRWFAGLAGGSGGRARGLAHRGGVRGTRRMVAGERATHPHLGARVRTGGADGHRRVLAGHGPDVAGVDGPADRQPVAGQTTQRAAGRGHGQPVRAHGRHPARDPDRGPHRGGLAMATSGASIDGRVPAGGRGMDRATRPGCRRRAAQAPAGTVVRTRTRDAGRRAHDRHRAPGRDLVHGSTTGCDPTRAAAGAGRLDPARPCRDARPGRPRHDVLLPGTSVPGRLRAAVRLRDPQRGQTGPARSGARVAGCPGRDAESGRPRHRGRDASVRAMPAGTSWAVSCSPSRFRHSWSRPPCPNETSPSTRPNINGRRPRHPRAPRPRSRTWSSPRPGCWAVGSAAHSSSWSCSW